jgi:hypothetical protein
MKKIEVTIYIFFIISTIVACENRTEYSPPPSKPVKKEIKTETVIRAVTGDTKEFQGIQRELNAKHVTLSSNLEIFRNSKSQSNPLEQGDIEDSKKEVRRIANDILKHASQINENKKYFRGVGGDGRRQSVQEYISYAKNALREIE